jgi:hypothetical protein
MGDLSATTPRCDACCESSAAIAVVGEGTMKVLAACDVITLEEPMTITRYTIVAAAMLVSATAMAQTPKAQDGPGNNAINSEQKNSNAPVAGRNSFTEGQARTAIEKAGYSNVTELKKDDDGVWRGKASKGGAASSVSVDFQGNVNAAK